MENLPEGYRSMYLSTIPNAKKKFVFEKSPLDVTDIRGARSRYIEKPLPQRETKSVNFDIEKSQPRRLIPEKGRSQCFVLSVDDIEGTRTKVNKFTTTRCTNPLQPQYQQPQVTYAPPEEPKFIRDNLAIDDIEGVRSRETFAIKLEKTGKVIRTKEEIAQGIKPTKKGFERTTGPSNNSLNVNDITKNNQHPHSKRTSDPLNPVYDIPGGRKAYGQIEGSRSVNKTAQDYNKTTYNLKTADIEGARPKYNNLVAPKKDEVPGAKASSLKRGVSSNRNTDPLQPRYDYPGWSQQGKGVTYTRPKTAHQRFDQFIK